VGGYLLIRRGGSYSLTHRIVLVGLVATLAGRLVEQQVGVARVSDLTIFWALLAIFAALPTVMANRESVPVPTIAPNRRPTRPSSRNRAASGSNTDGQTVNWGLFIRLSLVAWAVGGIFSLTWIKAINYPRAASAAGASVRVFQQEQDYQAALTRMEQAINLGPDVAQYYSAKASIYAAFLQNDQVPRELECRLEPNGVPYDQCLVQMNYFSSLAGVAQRPLSWRSRVELANASLARGLDEQATGLYREAADMVPASWPLRNRLAEAYVTIDRLDLALSALDESLAITGENAVVADRALTMRAELQRQLREEASNPPTP